MASKSNLCVSITLLCLFSVNLVVVGADLHRERRNLPTNSAESEVNSNQRPLSLSNQEQCVSFHHHYCSRFGYNSTISPNPWARGLTLEQATGEFDDFDSLLRNNCSDKLGIFLCFTYFPLCYELSLFNRQVILPCKETCDEVHASRCNDLVLNSVGQWGPHLQCSNFQSKTEIHNGNCADGGQDMTGDVTTTTMKPTVTTEGVKEVTTTEKEESEIENCEGRPNYIRGMMYSVASYQSTIKLMILCTCTPGIL